jgi:hypothetical protein
MSPGVAPSSAALAMSVNRTITAVSVSRARVNALSTWPMM